MQRQRGFLFWWSLANEMYISGNKKQQKCAIKIKNALMAKYGCDMALGLVLVKASCCLTIQVSSFTVM
ncbi:predicted serine acetlyltransferase [Escherichia coli]|nr:predicted serine acetlyltransferase [Escherichia coli]